MPFAIPLFRACIYSTTFFNLCQLFFVFFYLPQANFVVLHTFYSSLFRFLHTSLPSAFSTSFTAFYRYTYSAFFEYHILGLLILLMIFLWILLVLGGNRLLSSKCNLLHPLFEIEKRKDTLCLADFCLFWAETDNPLPCATRFSHFSESKRWPKDFRRSNAAAKPRLRGGFCAPKQTAPPKFQKSSFHIVHKTVLRNRRATGARMGLVSK